MAKGSWFSKQGVKARILWMVLATSVIACGTLAINYTAMTQQAQELELQASLVGRIVLLSDLVDGVKSAGLAAMDTIVDAESGIISSDAAAAFENFQQFRAKNRVIMETIGRDLGHRDDATQLLNVMTQFELDIGTLFEHVRSKAATATMLAESDDKIDASQVEASRLAHLFSSLTREQYRVSAEKAKNISESNLKLSVGANIGLLIVMLFLGTRTANGITRSTRKSSQDLDATVTTLIQATANLDRAGHTLAGTATEQNASVTETVSAMTEIQSVIRRSTDSSRSVVGLAREARVRSQEGSRIMAEMSRAMDAVKASSIELEKIVKIIQQIESKTNIVNNIAFKTQVLSFNASIEAARAGANGRGFAVVAMEVGRLADVSGKAAEEISALLRESVASVSDTVERLSSKVTEATHTKTEAHQRFDKIVDDISAIDGKIAEIEHGIREQSAGVDQCVKAMRQLSIASQSNDEMANEITDLSATLRTKSKDLETVARAYTAVIEGHKGTAGASAAEPAAPQVMETARQGESAAGSRERNNGEGTLTSDDAIIDDLAAAAARLTQDRVQSDDQVKKLRKSA